MSNKTRTKDEIKFDIAMIDAKMEILQTTRNNCLDELAYVSFKDTYPRGKKILLRGKLFVVLDYVYSCGNVNVPIINIARIKKDGTILRKKQFVFSYDFKNIKLLE